MLKKMDLHCACWDQGWNKCQEAFDSESQTIGPKGTLGIIKDQKIVRLAKAELDWGSLPFDRSEPSSDQLPTVRILSMALVAYKK